MVALFEVGAFTTSMQVIRNDEVLYDRDQAFGGAQLTQLIVRQYGFSAEEAESQEAQRRPAGRLRRRRAQALRREHGAGNRAARCSSSSPARRTTGSTTSCWPAARRRCRA